jgi:tetratricopeptide (TPR) repeat protein
MVDDHVKYQADELKKKGNEFYKKGQFEKALKFYDRALYIYPEYLDALNNMGMALVKLGRIDEANQCHREMMGIKNKISPESKKYSCSECHIVLEHKNSCPICGKHLCYLHIADGTHICIEHIKTDSRGTKPGARIRYLRDGWSGR